jgi:HYR domain-containing protein/galactose oxidase-like protein/Kelch motif protein
MATARSFHTATRLADGRVLITGGHQFNFFNSALSTAEIYDPGNGSFAPVGSMRVARQDHTATLLSDGRVLIAGGYGADQFGLTAVEIFDPVTRTFADTESLAARRGNHIAIMLPNGNVLIAGGHSDAPADSLSSAEIYDAALGRFTSTGNMTVARGSHAAALLSDGTVLIAGGYTAFPFLGTTLASAEIYNPMAGSFAPTATMPVARGRFIAAPLANGDVLVAGGFGVCCVALANAEVFSTLLVDTQPPLISVPPDLSVVATGTDGALVFYFASATDDIDGSPQLVCDPLSGSLFPIGTTTVVCTATDSASNTSSARFHVTVIKPLDIAVTIDPFGRVDSKSGVATVTGTVSCSRSAQFVNIFGRLVQLIANRATLTADYFVQTTCTPESPGTWSATVTAPNGRFRAGKADVNVSAFACDNLSSCDSSTEAGTIVLRSKK